MSAAPILPAALVLPYIWACESFEPEVPRQIQASLSASAADKPVSIKGTGSPVPYTAGEGNAASAAQVTTLPGAPSFAPSAKGGIDAAPAPRRVPAPSPGPSVDLYRRYTEALLRRYVRMSLEVGRTPSLLGREMFRAKVTSYRVQSFEDVVIFVHDIERCIAQLKPRHQEIIARMALQEYTVLETAALFRIPPMTALRRYGHALDRLTAILLSARMLERLR